MEKLVILDFNTGEVLIKYLENPIEDLDEYMEYLENTKTISSVSDCQWMLTKEDIIIK